MATLTLYGMDVSHFPIYELNNNTHFLKAQIEEDHLFSSLKRTEGAIILNSESFVLCSFSNFFYVKCFDWKFIFKIFYI